MYIIGYISSPIYIVLLGKVLISICNTVSANNREAVYIGGFFTSGNGWDIGPVLSSVNLALDHVNDNPGVLLDYELRMVWNNTQCDPNRATWALYQQLYTEPTKLALIGDACSVSTQAIAVNAGFWNLNTVSYGAGSPSLSNREEYPYFFRTVISDSLLNSARIQLMREFGWKRVAALHGTEEVFISAFKDLEERLEDANIDLMSSHEVTERNVQEVMESLKDIDAKIITLNMYSATAQFVFCEAYHRGMIGQGYVWITAGFYDDRWWKQAHNDGKPMNCSDEEMRMAIESSYYISTEMQLIGSSETVTIANITTKEYIKQLGESLNQPNDVNFTYHLYGPLAYDAIWAIALMLDKASERTKRSLTEFTYQDKAMAATFFELLSETHFTGVSGEVKFDNNGGRMGRVEIRQFQSGCSEGWHLIKSACVQLQPLNESMSQHSAEQNCLDQEADYLDKCPDSLEYVFEFDDSKLEEKDDPQVYCCKQPADFQEQLVAVFVETTGGSGWEQNGNFTWPGSQIPTDQTAAEIIRVRLNVIKPWHYLPFYAFSVLGVMLCFILLVFNNVYRNHWHVKRGSPPMNNLIIVSCLLIYLLVFPASMENSDLPTRYQMVACRARTVILSLGIVLGFGTMVTKTWRVYKMAVFRNATPKQISIRNKKLYLIISILVGINVLILLVVCSFVGVQEDITSEEVDPHIANKKTEMFFEYCMTQHESFLRVVLWGYHGVLVVLGIFLAWQTRHIPKKFAGLVDNKSIGICIYMLALVFAVYLFYIVLAGPNPITRFIVKSSIYLYYTTFTLVLLFAPMVKSVVNKDPVPRSDPGNRAVDPGANNYGVNLDNNQQAQNVNRPESEDPHNSRIDQVHEQDNASSCGCMVWCYGMTCRGCSWPKRDVYNVSAVGAASKQNQNEITGSAP